MKKELFFVLGARDPECAEIANVLEANNVPYGIAMVERGKFYNHGTNSHFGSLSSRKGPERVQTFNAYQASSIRTVIPLKGDNTPDRVSVVLVECGMDVSSSHILRGYDFIRVDHHHPGDPGYELGPENYFEGSSIGQVCNLLGIEPSTRQRIIAAADHCLAAAYGGMCKGVDPEELLRTRVEIKCFHRNTTETKIVSDIHNAAEAIKQSKRITLFGEELADFMDFNVMSSIPELTEASALLGIGILKGAYIRDIDHYKYGIFSRNADVIQGWMSRTATGSLNLKNIYGSPSRGYAGGYRSTHFGSTEQ